MMNNVTGWNELMNGKLIDAAFTMYDLNFAGWFVAIVFFTFQFMLYIKTRNSTLTFVTGVIFASLYASTTFVNAHTKELLFIALILQLAGILYMVFFKSS